MILTERRQHAEKTMKRKKSGDFQKISKVKVTLKAAPEKAWKMSVKMVNNWRKKAKNSPTQPPTKSISSDFIRKAARMLFH